MEKTTKCLHTFLYVNILKRNKNYELAGAKNHELS